MKHAAPVLQQYCRVNSSVCVFRGWRKTMVCCRLRMQTVSVSVTVSKGRSRICCLTQYKYGVSLFLGSLVVNGNTSCSIANSKTSPESNCSWFEDGCNGHAPGRFSSPASGLSGFSSSVMSATSESALSTQSGYSSGREGWTRSHVSN